MHTLEQTRDAWNAVAEGYDRHVTPSHRDLSEKVLRQAGLQKGMRFLDVACGSGALSLAAAETAADVVATDISPAMIDLLHERARHAKLANIRGEVMDGHALDFADDRFDVAASQYGVMLFPQVDRALSEMARVTKPGGRVAVTAIGPFPRVEFLTYFAGAMQAVVEGFKPPFGPASLPFQLSDPTVFASKMESAGLSDVRIETVSERLHFPSGRHMFDWFRASNPIGADMVADLGEEQTHELIDVLDGMLRERAWRNNGAVLDNEIHIATGTK